ncbi:MAG TPA: hypothetical protein VIU61_17365 [Kofleriaceae bacterium]
MSYRDDVTALAARHDSLATEVAHKTRELEDATRLLEEAQAKARLPVLDNIRIAAPCDADWSKMTGDDRARHCGDCKKTVFNLSDMTRPEAEALIIEKQGKLCVRYFQRSDGTILTKDCPVGVARRRKRRLIAAGAVAMLAGGGALVWKTLRSDLPPPPAELPCKMHNPRDVIEMETMTVEPEQPRVLHEVKGGPMIEEPVTKIGKVNLVR